MSKRCAKCEKTVYPTEELKCLDKVWHKGCFRCESCGMTLNMKNYKGYDKKPYCNAHYPTTKFTAVADTPENLRIAQNTKNQSSIKYHEDFEKNIKGTKTTVSDDPETVRVQQQSKLISQVEYHGLKKKQEEQERQRASVTDDMQPTHMTRRPMGGLEDTAAGDNVPSPYTAKFTGHSTTYGAGGKVEHSVPKRNIGSISDYDPMQNNWGSLNQGYAPQPTTAKTQQWEETVPQVPRQQQQNPQYNGGEQGGQQQNVPMVPVNQPLELMVRHPEQEQSHQQQPAYYPAPAQTQQQTSPRNSYNQPQQQSPRHSYQQQQQSPRQSYQQPASPRRAAPPPSRGPLYRSMYDYEAQDDDEVSFLDGDYVIDTEPIDDGWMYGTVERTGKRGMLPANYVERVQ